MEHYSTLQHPTLLLCQALQHVCKKEKDISKRLFIAISQEDDDEISWTQR